MSSKIYGLREKGKLEIRYVGMTKQELNQRFNEHMLATRKGKKTYVYNWIRKIQLNNSEVEIVLLEDGLTDEFARVKEQCWVNYFELQGIILTNIAPGGRGGNVTKNFTQEQLLDYKLAKSRAMKGKNKQPKSEEHKEKMRQAKLGLKRVYLPDGKFKMIK